MSFHDVFRGFFGFPGARRPRDPLFGPARWGDEEEDEEEDGAALPPLPPLPPPLLPGAAAGLAELLGALAGAERGGGGGGEAPPGRSLRDSLLKRPEGPRGPRRDRDLDAQVSAGGLGSVLRPPHGDGDSDRGDSDRGTEPRGYFCSVSVTTVTLPDGAVEQRRTVRDSQGRRETTVTRRGGPEDGGGCRELLRDGDDRALFGGWQHQDLPADSSSVLGRLLGRWFSGW